jgi:hypothetical protein
MSAKRHPSPALPFNTLRVREGSIPPKQNLSLEQLQGGESKEENKKRSPSLKNVERKWWKLDSFEWDILLVGTAAKLLLFPA